MSHAAPAVDADQRTDRDERDHELDQQFEPVDAIGVGGNANRAGDECADERRDDADDDRQPDRDVLLAWQDEPGQATDDGADDDGSNDSGDGHGDSFGLDSGNGPEQSPGPRR